MAVQLSEQKDFTCSNFFNRENAVQLIGCLCEEGWISDEVYGKCIKCIESSKVQEESILVLELPTTIHRTLDRADIKTVNQLRYLLLGNEHPGTHKELVEIRNLGDKGVLVLLQKAMEKNIIQRDEIGVKKIGKRNKAKWARCIQALKECS